MAFRLDFKGPTCNQPTRSATAHPNVVEEYLKHKLSLGRMSGPYPISVCPDVHVSRFGVIPKAHQPGKWRLITDLSHPQGHSINDGIPPHLCSLSYVTIDDAICNILQLGKDTMLTKITFSNLNIEFHVSAMKYY